MENKSLTATMFISLVAMAALTIVVKGALSIHPLHPFQFASLLLLGVLTSRLKVTLPGLTGNMSMNLPFVLLAIVQLGLFEAAAIAFASTLIQSLPKRGLQLRPTHLLFNVSTMTTAAGFAYLSFMNSNAGTVLLGLLRWCSPLPLLLDQHSAGRDHHMSHRRSQDRSHLVRNRASLFSLLRSWYWNDVHSDGQEWLHGLGIVDRCAASNDRNLS